MKLAIVGSRTFNDEDLLHNIIMGYMWKEDWSLTIISGGATGADSLAKEFAETYGYNYIEYPAEWDKYGKSAGYKRNKLIVDNCDIVLAFWDGKSKGTKHTIDLAREAKKPTFIVYF